MEEKRPRGRPPTGVKAHKRSTTFPPSVYKRLEELARKQERTVNELIVQAVRNLLKEEGMGQRKPTRKAA